MTGESEVTALAQRWRIAVADIGFVPMSMRELDRLLARLVERIIAAATTEPFDPADAAEVGAALVRANLTDPRVLTRSAVALTPLTEIVAPHGDRMVAVFGELSRGYTETLLSARAHDQEMLHTAMAEARHAAEVRFRVMFDNAAVAIGIGDTAGRVVDVNPALSAMLGLPGRRLRGRPVAELVHPDDRDHMRERVYGELLASGSGTIRLELRYLLPDGGSGWAAWAITLVPASGGRAAYLLVVGEDTTQRRALQAELHRQARHDPLTGLPNRRQLVDALSRIIAEARTGDRVGLGFIDLDGFKTINDTYGHGVGDRLLTAVAERLAAHARGAMLARIGGDEFVVLFAPPCDSVRMAHIVETMLNALSDPIGVDDHLLRVTACIGAVVTPVANADAERLLDAADAGLYRAKAAGPNRWVLHGVDVTAGAFPGST
ncbi:diguanylate cyclase domain-containing protein [Nocardia sp. NPDC004068]|uniref:diguanylate cyclase domain-containing protein n=1 Tax=Nocardia sp. NPDC004068 TaxID=3364303 RepID=UPI0036AC2620